MGELCPLGRNTEGWSYVDTLVDMSAETWYANLARRRLESLRPVMAEALDGALATVRAMSLHSKWECGFSGITANNCQARGCLWTVPNIGSREAAAKEGIPW